MKKKIMTLAVVLSAAFFSLSGFKAPVSSDPPVKAVKTALSFQFGNFAEQPTGTAEMSEELFNAALSGSLLEGVRTGDHSYLARNVINTTPVVDPPRDPCTNSVGDSWAQFYAWYAANYPAMQAWANANCRPARFAWGNRCICILGLVPPQGNCDVRYVRVEAAFE